jgi:hypothetical protein
VFGCERTENAKDAVPIHAENVETVSASKDDVTAATLARITSASVTLTNYLYCESDKVMGLCQRIGSDISTLPPEIGQQCVKEIVRSVVAIPYERLEYGARYRALDKIGIALNFVAMLFVLPIIYIVSVFVQAYPTGPDWLYQAYLCIPQIIPFSIAASLSLRRKGFGKSGFFIQFLAPSAEVMLAILEYIL